MTTAVRSPISLDEITVQKMVENSTLTITCRCGQVNVVEPIMIEVDAFLGGGGIEFTAGFGSAADFCSKCEGFLPRGELAD